MRPPLSLSRPRRRWMALLAAAAVAVAPLVTTALPAQAAATSTISGVVTGDGGPIAGVDVMPYVYDSEWDEWVPEPSNATETGPDGSFSLTDLRATAYRIGVDGGSEHVGEFWNDAATLADADTLPLPSGSTRSGINLRLATRPHIGGLVTDGAGTPVADVRVTLLAWDELWFEWGSVDGVPSVQTGSDGRYDLPRVPPGTYRLEFADDTGVFDQQYYDGAEDVVDATDVTVGPGASRTDVDVTLVAVGEPGVLRNRSLPTITGHPAVGAPLTADPGRWAPGTGVDFDYQWLVAGAPVVGATDVTFSPRQADLGKTVTVRVDATREGYTSGTATSAPTVAVGSQPAVVNTVKPAISGTPKVGRTLSATPGTWSPSTGLTHTFQWLVDGTEVPGATTDNFTLRPEDIDGVVTVRVTTSKDLHSAGTATSEPTAAVALGTLTSTAAPVITGSPVVGTTLQLDPGTWSPGDVDVEIEWYVAGLLVEGVTGTSYSPVEADVDKAVSVTVRATRDGYEPASRTSANIGPVTLPLLSMTAAPTVTGTPQVGSTLTATPGTWLPADGLSFTYTWSAGASTVAEGPEPTYSPTAQDVGKPITVRVAASRAGYATATRATTTPAVFQTPTTNPTAPKITGIPQVGQTLTADAGQWLPSTVTTTYQWLVGGVPAAGQTARTFVVPPTALGKPVAVRVTGSGSGPALAVTTPATANVKAGVLRSVKAPAVTGTAAVGKVLKGNPGTVSPAATKVTYQWLRNGKAIRGATKATYKLTAADRRTKVSLKVTYIRAGYTTLSKTSKVLTVR